MRLVLMADDLHYRIEAYGQLMELVMVEVYRGEHEAHEARILIQAAADIQADLLQRYYLLRLRKTILARFIDSSNPFH